MSRVRIRPRVSRQTVTLIQDGKRVRIQEGLSDLELTYSAEDLLALAAIFEGAARMLAERGRGA